MENILDKEALDNLATYRRWKDECAKKGKSPGDMVDFYRSIGQTEYAAEVETVIQKMEALSALLA